jgi:hypothetical protein
MKSRVKFQHTQQDLLAALSSLRHLIREVGGNYLAGLQADVAAVERAVRQLEDEKTRADLQVMLGAIQNIDVKPQKGRRRDLKELDKVVTKLADTTGGW